MKKVLIVEDDEEVAQALCPRMRAAGYDTSVAYEGLSGVMSAARIQPDAVLLNIRLPAGNGFSMAQPEPGLLLATHVDQTEQSCRAGIRV